MKKIKVLLYKEECVCYSIPSIGPLNVIQRGHQGKIQPSDHLRDFYMSPFYFRPVRGGNKK